jgi:iron(III) transport system ATP-binding protein
MSSVKVSSLSKSFGSVTAVNAVSFEVPTGRVLTMLGPSGCGKTTILRCIAGLETGTSGSISIADRIVFADGRIVVPVEDRNIGMMFQSYAIWPHMTIFDNVAFGLRVRRVPSARIKEKVGEALSLVRMSGKEKRYPGELSGGQMQRVVLARSLAYDPSLLLLDEPLANLDTNLREEMRTELRRIQRETGATMIAVTHDQGEALALSDEILVMSSGGVLQRGAPRDIFDKPKTRQVAQFLGAANVVPGRASADGFIVIEGIGPLPVSSQATSGDALSICFRPADVQLGNPDRPGTILCTVETVEYLGTATHYLFQSALGRLEATTPERSVEYRVGDRVGLAIDPSRALVFPEKKI